MYATRLASAVTIVAPDRGVVHNWIGVSDGQRKGFVDQDRRRRWAAKDRAQEVGASLVKKAQVVTSDARREAGKARSGVQRKARAVTASVKRTVNAAEADAERALSKAKRKLKSKVKAAAAGAKTAAGNVERAMSQKKPAAKR